MNVLAPNKELHLAALKSTDKKKDKSGISINPHHESLHSVLGIPETQKIPMARMQQAKNSPNPAIRKKANFAVNASKWHHG